MPSREGRRRRGGFTPQASDMTDAEYLALRMGQDIQFLDRVLMTRGLTDWPRYGWQSVHPCRPSQTERRQGSEE